MLLNGKFYINAREFGRGKNKHIAYSTGITSKDKEGNKITGYLNVQLSREAQKFLDKNYDLENGDSALIQVNEGWLGAYEKNDGTTGIKLFFNDIEEVEEDEEPEEKELFVAPKKKTTTKTTTNKKTTKK